MDRQACSEYRELISAFVDGEISHDERTRLMAHVAGCVDCRETLEVYRLIGTRIRAMPAVAPPDQLIETIFAETIDAQPRRLFIVSSRLGYSLAAVAAVLLIFVVAVYLIVGGYQRGVQPKIADTAPGDGDTWPIQRPIEITFNKAMDHASVESALAILPTEDDQLLARSWDGNTLIIGGNQNLKPGTTYQILISGSAVDTYGNKLGADFRLSFGTTSTVTVPESPTPQPTVAQSATPTVPLAAISPTAESSATSERPGVGEPTSTAGAAQTPPAASSGGDGTPGTSVPSTPTPNQPTATPEPTETSVIQPTEDPFEQPTATPTTEPEPIATSTPTPTEPPVPTATATPTTPPTATPPLPTPTEVAIPVTGGFGDVYWGDATIRERLGLPLAAASSTGALQLDFQHGTMYYRGDIGTIYVLNTEFLLWGSFLDTSTSSPEPEAGPEPDTWIPGGILGYLWAAEQSVRDELGYATQQYPASFSAQVQQFEGGIMISSPDIIWVLYNDLTYEWFGNSGG